MAAILLILHYLRQTRIEELSLVLSLALILAGAVGNLIDRIRFGEVVDFLDVYIGAHHWPAFNVADAAITDRRVRPDDTPPRKEEGKDGGEGNVRTSPGGSTRREDRT